MELETIAAMPDPEEQGRRVSALLRALDVAHKEAIELRHLIVDKLREPRPDGSQMSVAEVAQILGVDRVRAWQIANRKHTGRKPRTA